VALCGQVYYTLRRKGSI